MLSRLDVSIDLVEKWYLTLANGGIRISDNELTRLANMIAESKPLSDATKGVEG